MSIIEWFAALLHRIWPPSWQCLHCGQTFSRWGAAGAQPSAAGWCCFCDQYAQPMISRGASTTRGKVAVMGGDGTGTPTSPYTYAAIDVYGKALRISVPFDLVTLALLDVTVTRDAGCLYAKIYIGVGGDGTPDTTVHQFSVPTGTRTITTGQLGANGLHVYDDFASLQITAGP